MNLSVPRRYPSPLAIVNALALTIATLLTTSGVVCYLHDAPAASNAWSTLDREAEATGATNGARLGNAAAPHEHSCVACRTESSRPDEVGRSSVARPLDPAAAMAKPENDGNARRGESRPQAARGPPAG